ncbi:hypothetical protein ABW20_dc0100267 [Dactylellina cionopaga]|nr:hypothetical protein ABW20_dc0100267 [Dactylellina cionopaga]
MVNLPLIKVSPTLADLYPTLKKPIALVPIIVLSNRELTDSVPQSSKFLYQDTTTNQNDEENDVKDGDASNGDNLEEAPPTVKYLSLIPQRFAFAAGNMPVVVFDLHPEEAEAGRKHAQSTLSVIEESSRPKLHFFSGPGDEKFSTDKWTLANSFPMDGLESHSHVISTETHYEILSKGGLAISGLQTPACKRLVVESISGPFNRCCEVCLGGGSSEIITDDCTGHRGKWLAKEVEKIIQGVREHSIPYVLKFQQTVSGAGTYIITKQSEREELLRDLPAILKSHLPKINRKNRHLDPGDVLITDSSRISKIHCHSLSSSKLMGTAYLSAAPNNTWTTKDIGKFLHEKGYYGPVGADILEDKSGVQWVVDLNVRTPSSLVLGVLEEHFKSRGFDVATLVSETLGVLRKDFYHLFKQQLEDGRIVIVGWYEDDHMAWAELVIAGETQKEMKALKEKVEENCLNV